MRRRDIERAIKTGRLVDVRENRKERNAAGKGLKVLSRVADFYLIGGLKASGGWMAMPEGSFALAKDISWHVPAAKEEERRPVIETAPQKAAQEPFPAITEKALAYFLDRMCKDRFEDIGRHIVEMFRGVGCLDTVQVTQGPDAIAVLEAAKDAIEKETDEAIGKLAKGIEKKFTVINEAIAILKGGE